MKIVAELAAQKARRAFQPRARLFGVVHTVHGAYISLGVTEIVRDPYAYHGEHFARDAGVFKLSDQRNKLAADIL